ncbi:MAG: hypothetical protein D6694_15560, partial [Gammaproteobacteria bacterium]
ASATALQVIPGIDENLAQAIIERRAGPDGMDGTEDDMPYRSPAELGLGGLPGSGAPVAPGAPPPVVASAMAQLFTVRSLVFEVRVEAHIGSIHREYVALVRRNSPRVVQVLSFTWN